MEGKDEGSHRRGSHDEVLGDGFNGRGRVVMTGTGREEDERRRRWRWMVSRPWRLGHEVAVDTHGGLRRFDDGDGRRWLAGCVEDRHDGGARGLLGEGELGSSSGGSR